MNKEIKPISPPVYAPAEDSFLLSQVIEDYLESKNKEELEKLTFLDMGTGSGIQSETASQFIPKDNIYAVDINEAAVKLVKSKGFKATRSDLFSDIKLRAMKFDIIAFNPPYLPEDEEGFDNLPDTTGGEKGDEVALVFLQVSKNYLTQNGVIFLLVSSLTPTEKLKAEIQQQGKKLEVVASKKLFFETLEVWKID